MESEDGQVHCGGCGAMLDEATGANAVDRLACPHCGSELRRLTKVSADTALLRDTAILEGFIPPSKKPYLEARAGEVQQSDGTYKHVERVINRQEDIYFERVMDLATGIVKHECAEPLSQHRGHGADKRKVRPRNEGEKKR